MGHFQLRKVLGSGGPGGCCYGPHRTAGAACGCPGRWMDPGWMDGHVKSMAKFMGFNRDCLRNKI